jgi:transcriptional regulator CtsR
MLIQQQRIELQRRELAKMFRCAPSQINYVLETRFTFERGFLVESKRGGGGYIRITPIPWENEFDILQMVDMLVPEEVGDEQVDNLLRSLIDRDVIESDDALLCREVLTRYFLNLPDEGADCLRARLIKALLVVMSIRKKE